MSKIKTRFAFFVLCGGVALLISGCGGIQSAKTNPPPAPVPPAAPLASDDATNESALRFLESRVKSDPEDFSANSKLAGLYLQKLRETGNVQYLDLTFRAARASLASVSEVRNTGGLAALAQAEFASHEFTRARDDISGAIEFYEKAVNRLPDPAFIAALGDLYKLAGREEESNAQYQLVEQIARLNSANGVLFSRQLALFYADHDMNGEEAYAGAVKEYETRRDIYGADAVAWTALKAGKLPEAQKFIREALRLGTQDALLLYHAGIIARVAGDDASARDYLRRALKLNPRFDSLQALIAKRALDG